MSVFGGNVFAANVFGVASAASSGGATGVIDIEDRQRVRVGRILVPTKRKKPKQEVEKKPPAVGTDDDLTVALILAVWWANA